MSWSSQTADWTARLTVDAREAERAGRSRILVVEDNWDVLELVQSSLEDAGYAVITATDGREGLDKARSARPDLVVLDVLLPELDGWEVLRRIGADPATAGLPVIMLTCMSEDADVLRGLQEGAVNYITKPFYPEDLVASVKILLHVFDESMRDGHRRQLIARRHRLAGSGPGPMGASQGQGSGVVGGQG